jgi:hypothetical protein
VGTSLDGKGGGGERRGIRSERCEKNVIGSHCLRRVSGGVGGPGGGTGWGLRPGARGFVRALFEDVGVTGATVPRPFIVRPEETSDSTGPVSSVVSPVVSAVVSPVVSLVVSRCFSSAPSLAANAASKRTLGPLGSLQLPAILPSLSVPLSYPPPQPHLNSTRSLFFAALFSRRIDAREGDLIAPRTRARKSWQALGTAGESRARREGGGIRERR